MRENVIYVTDARKHFVRQYKGEVNFICQRSRSRILTLNFNNGLMGEPFMFCFSKSFIRDESGAAIVEYGLALLVVASIAVGAFTFLGTTTAGNVAAACDALNTTNNC